MIVPEAYAPPTSPPLLPSSPHPPHMLLPNFVQLFNSTPSSQGLVVHLFEQNNFEGRTGRIVGGPHADDQEGPSVAAVRSVIVAVV